jgi:hypothetical protein
MEKEIDLLTPSIAVGVATYVAIILACVARDHLGFSSGQTGTALSWPLWRSRLRLSWACSTRGRAGPDEWLSLDLSSNCIARSVISR